MAFTNHCEIMLLSFQAEEILSPTTRLFFAHLPPSPSFTFLPNFCLSSVPTILLTQPTYRSKTFWQNDHFVRVSFIGKRGHCSPVKTKNNCQIQLQKEVAYLEAWCQPTDLTWNPKLPVLSLSSRPKLLPFPFGKKWWGEVAEVPCYLNSRISNQYHTVGPCSLTDQGCVILHLPFSEGHLQSLYQTSETFLSRPRKSSTFLFSYPLNFPFWFDHKKDGWLDG